MSADGATGRHGRDDDVVVRKADHGWVVGGENVSGREVEDGAIDSLLERAKRNRQPVATPTPRL